ncbi:MAG: phytanoyl-CoA dioxygenase family protein [Planctomycetes bacterium]|nr:phytanoyl-CoA dioxygenase family protein [Planctomycetota bacterium]
MMTDEQRYLFDLQGYLVVPGVLKAKQLAQIETDLVANGVVHPDNNPSETRFSNFFAWGQAWRDLIDEPTILPILVEMIGPKIRLHHAYGMAMSAKGHRGGEVLHHEAGLFNEGIYYATHGSKMHNGLMVVSYALRDVPPGAGGFCCVPGSHKSIYRMPQTWFSVDRDIVKHVPMKAGDCLIFTEALTHGTMPWTHEAWERRSVLLKYAPYFMQWNYTETMSATEGLSEPQKLLLKGDYVWQGKAAL